MVEVKKTQPNKKTFYEVFFKSREFITDVYLRFDCFLYLILGGFGFYNPTGLANLLNYKEYEIFNNTTTTIINNDIINNNNNNNMAEQYSTYSSSEEDVLQQSVTTSSGDSNFIPLNENPLILGIATMYSFLLALIAIFQCIVSLVALIQKENKAAKSILINLSLTLNFFLILFNTYVILYLPHVFTRFANMGKLVSYGIAILDFTALFILSGKHKSLFSIISSIISFCFKFKLPRKLPNLSNKNNNKKRK